MKSRTARFATLTLALAIFLGACSYRSREDAPLATSNTSGTTYVNGTEVHYEYDGEFYILAKDMLFNTLDELRSHVADPFGEGEGGELSAAQTDGTDGVLRRGHAMALRQDSLPNHGL